MSGTTRYQGAVIRDHHILLIEQLERATGRRSWLLPGGRIEPGETEEQCVRRELLEETYVHVQVQYLLLDEPAPPGSVHRRWKTYVCHVLNGDARPGHEPEFAASGEYQFTQVGWIDLRRPATWGRGVVSNPRTYALLQRVQAALGYEVAGVDPDAVSGIP